MIFDLFGRMVGAHYPPLRSILAKAKVFQIPAYAKEILNPNRYSDSDMQLLDDFFLPFEICAIEDKTSCTILWPQVAGSVGVNCTYFFADCMPLCRDDYDNSLSLRDEEMAIADILKEASTILDKDECVITYGTISDVWHDKKQHLAHITLIGLILGRPDQATVYTMEQLKAEGDFMYEGASKHGGTNASTAMEEVVWFNTPNRFVLERTPIRNGKNGKRRKQAKIRPSTDRPIYTLLTPPEIREVMELPEPTARVGAGKTAHERRAHRRYYKAERYSEERRAKPQLIPATWVGPKESVVGNHRYRVRVDI